MSRVDRAAEADLLAIAGRCHLRVLPLRSPSSCLGLTFACLRSFYRGDDVLVGELILCLGDENLLLPSVILAEIEGEVPQFAPLTFIVN